MVFCVLTVRPELVEGLRFDKLSTNGCWGQRAA